jgi:uncharacterized protein (UPF0548 family)
MRISRAWSGGATHRRTDLTYREQGATRDALPTGYHHVHRRALLGTSQVAFEQAARTLCRWDMHRRAGLAVTASSPVALPDTVVLLTLGWRWLSINAPCRVVYTVEERNRRGVAYGTLPGHNRPGQVRLRRYVRAGRFRTVIRPSSPDGPGWSVDAAEAAAARRRS